MPKERIESVHTRVWLKTLRILKSVKLKDETLTKTIHAAALKLQQSRKRKTETRHG